jgi:hypothetical protein
MNAVPLPTVADRLGQGQGAQQVGEVIGQRVQLQPHRVRGEAATGLASLVSYPVSKRPMALSFGKDVARLSCCAG